MAKVFVANCTQQHHIFMYRVPESPGVRSQTIAPGGQIQLSGDFNAPQIESIVAQHSRYGMVHVSEIDRTKPFAHLCWQQDKPINVNAIMKGLDHNYRILDARGHQIRKDSAVAAASQAEQVTQTPINTYDVSVTEEVKDGGTPSINEGVRVTAREPATPPESGRRSRRAA